MNIEAEISDSKNSNLNKEALKKELVERLFPKKALKPQWSKNAVNMRLRSKFKFQKKEYWLRKGFSNLEATFLAFQNVPNKTSVEDCVKLLELCNRRDSSGKSRSQSLNETKNPTIVVAFESPPKYKSFNKLVNEIQLALKEELNKLPQGKPIEIIDSYTEGNLVLICQNIDTKKWVEDIVHSLVIKDPDSGDEVKLVSREVPVYPTNSVKITGHIPCQKGDILTKEEVLKQLSDQNPPLVTTDWATLEFRSVRTGIKMILLIDEKFLEVMKKINWSLNYNGQKAKFQVETRFRSLNFWNKVDQKTPDGKVFESQNSLSLSKNNPYSGNSSRGRIKVPTFNKNQNTSKRGVAKNRPGFKRGHQVRGGQNNISNMLPYSGRNVSDISTSTFHDDGARPSRGFQVEDRDVPYFEGRASEIQSVGFHDYNPRGRFEEGDNNSSVWGNDGRNSRDNFFGRNYRDQEYNFQPSSYRNSRGLQNRGYNNPRGGFGSNHGNSARNFRGGDDRNFRSHPSDGCANDNFHW